MENQDSITLTLEQAAEKHSTHAKSPVGSILYIHKTTAFKAGAAWQKEQYKRLFELIKEAQSVLLNEGLDDLSGEIDNELERLQD
jgi:hypothetical protein